MSYTYEDLRRVEQRIQELNALCNECLFLKNRLRSEIAEPIRALEEASHLIRSQEIWRGEDANSCGDAVYSIRERLYRARNGLDEALGTTLYNALMDEVHRQQAKHSRIYRELSELEIIAGRIMD